MFNKETLISNNLRSSAIFKKISIDDCQCGTIIDYIQRSKESLMVVDNHQQPSPITENDEHLATHITNQRWTISSNHQQLSTTTITDFR